MSGSSRAYRADTAESRQSENAAPPHRLITEWSTPDPMLAKVLTDIAALPPFSIERLELEAYLHMTQARVCWRLIDQQRASERRRSARAR